MPIGYDAIYDINNVQCLVKLAYTLIVCRYVYDINNVQVLGKTCLHVDSMPLCL